MISSVPLRRDQIVNPYVIHGASIVGKTKEAEDIHTFRLQFVDGPIRQSYRFSAGQFNMVYLFGVGEVAISIVSDPDEPQHLDHTIRAVGRVTHAVARLKEGDVLGVRGPFGVGWPLDRLCPRRGRD